MKELKSILFRHFIVIFNWLRTRHWNFSWPPDISACVSPKCWPRWRASHRTCTWTCCSPSCRVSSCAWWAYWTGRRSRDRARTCTASPRCGTACAPSGWSSSWTPCRSTRTCPAAPGLSALVWPRGQRWRPSDLSEPAPWWHWAPSVAAGHQGGVGAGECPSVMTSCPRLLWCDLRDLGPRLDLRGSVSQASIGRQTGSPAPCWWGWAWPWPRCRHQTPDPRAWAESRQCCY